MAVHASNTKALSSWKLVFAAAGVGQDANWYLQTLLQCTSEGPAEDQGAYLT
jgi:hypothetical protein